VPNYPASHCGRQAINIHDLYFCGQRGKVVSGNTKKAYGVEEILLHSFLTLTLNGTEG
jgi:hypothetical protein